jgi:hypothetical protein
MKDEKPSSRQIASSKGQHNFAKGEKKMVKGTHVDLTVAKKKGASSPIMDFFSPKKAPIPMEQLIAEAREAALEAAALASRGIILEHSLVPNAGMSYKSKSAERMKQASLTRLQDPSSLDDTSKKEQHGNIVSDGSSSHDTASQTTFFAKTPPRKDQSKNNHDPATPKNGIAKKSSKPKDGKSTASKDSNKKSSKFGKKKRSRDDTYVGTSGSKISYMSPRKHFKAGATVKKPLKKGDSSALMNPDEHLSPHDAKRLTKELWTCSLCSAAFESEHRAEAHEKDCVRRACRPDKFFEPFGPALNPTAPPDLEDESQGMIKSDGEIIVGIHVRQMMIMTDESLAKVVKLANSYMCTPEELQAERELALLARNEEYYRHLKRRAQVRRMTKGR